MQCSDEDMRVTPAGDVDYERGESPYAAVRQPDPRFALRIRQALGDAKTLINVGAGAGSYEPLDLEVTAVEPSASMRAERPAHLSRAIDAVAEDLPFPDQCFDAALASVTIHQWRDLAQGLSELRRVTKGPIVLLTFDGGVLQDFWLKDYAPRLMVHEAGRMPAISLLKDLLGGTSEVVELPIPFDCEDGFGEAFFGRPEAFLDEHVRASQSAWKFLSHDEIATAMDQLRCDLEDGIWDAKFGHLRTAPDYPGALRLLINHPEKA